jgi:hypothetical protein
LAIGKLKTIYSQPDQLDGLIENNFPPRGSPHSQFPSKLIFGSFARGKTNPKYALIAEIPYHC